MSISACCARPAINSTNSGDVSLPVVDPAAGSGGRVASDLGAWAGAGLPARTDSRGCSGGGAAGFSSGNGRSGRNSPLSSKRRRSTTFILLDPSSGSLNQSSNNVRVPAYYEDNAIQSRSSESDLGDQGRRPPRSALPKLGFSPFQERGRTLPHLFARGPDTKQGRFEETAVIQTHIES